MRTEAWNGHAIRFVEKGGQWWAVAADVCAALDIENASQAVRGIQNFLRDAGLDEKGICSTYTLPTNGGKQKCVCVNEAGLNPLIMRSRKKEAVAFQYWIASEVLPTLRESAGLSEYSVSKAIYRKYGKGGAA